MKIKFINLDNDMEHIAERFEECCNETERELWKMHEERPDRCWKLGKTVAERLEVFECEVCHMTRKIEEKGNFYCIDCEADIDIARHEAEAEYRFFATGNF